MHTGLNALPGSGWAEAHTPKGPTQVEQLTRSSAQKHTNVIPCHKAAQLSSASSPWQLHSKDRGTARQARSAWPEQVPEQTKPAEFLPPRRGRQARAAKLPSRSCSKATTKGGCSFPGVWNAQAARCRPSLADLGKVGTDFGQCRATVNEQLGKTTKSRTPTGIPAATPTGLRPGHRQDNNEATAGTHGASCRSSKMSVSCRIRQNLCGIDLVPKVYRISAEVGRVSSD